MKFYVAPPKMRIAPQMPPQIPRPGAATAHPDKSVLIPTQQLVFLGFILDSLLMLVRLTPEKATK